MNKTWDIMLNEVFDEDSIKDLCRSSKDTTYDVETKTIRVSGSQEKLNELSRAAKKYAEIWGVILLW